MDYKVIEGNRQVILEGIRDFELPHTFECGQCFRWHREEDNSYTGVAHGRILNVKKEKNQLFLNNTTSKEFHEIWRKYFDLDRDYGEIKESLCKGDPVMEKAMEKGHGIRILKQDEWETLISFIISSNRSIPLIKRSIEELSERYGKLIGEYRGRKYYSFPEPEALQERTLEDIQLCKTGYRAKYILDAAAMVAQKKIEIYHAIHLDTPLARKELLRVSGVGPKVADCVLLFSMNKSDAFPIDVWVKRVMEYFYLPQDTSLKKIQDFAETQFGAYCGFAQQYLFHYARELGIGKN